MRHYHCSSTTIFLTLPIAELREDKNTTCASVLQSLQPTGVELWPDRISYWLVWANLHSKLPVLQISLEMIAYITKFLSLCSVLAELRLASINSKYHSKHSVVSELIRLMKDVVFAWTDEALGSTILRQWSYGMNTQVTAMNIKRQGHT